VLYRSPTQFLDLSGFAVRSAAQVIEAAAMSCADSLPYSMLAATCEAAIIGRDLTGDPAQTHVALAADREDVAEAIVHLVEEAGLRFLSATPLDAALMANFVKRELAGRQHRGALYIGQYTSFFVVVSRGTLLFSRRIDLGIETLVTSLTRPINIAGRPEIELTVDEARALLAKHGIPDRDEHVHEEHGLTGMQVVPLLQPVLQRFIVELRQSLRFGLDEANRKDLSLWVTGGGSALKNLATVIGRELGIESAGDTAYPDPDADRERKDAIADRVILSRLNLMPRPMAMQRRTAKLRRWMMTGASAAMVLIAVEGARYHTQVRSAQSEADVYASQLEDLKALESTQAKLKVVMGAKAQLQKAIHEEIGLVNNYRACMQELSLITPPTIRFTRIEFRDVPKGGGGTLAGFAFPSTKDAHRTDLESFIEAMKGSPLFTDVVLGNVQIKATGASDGQQFHASFDTVPAARNPLEGRQLAEAETGGAS
jgi:Tfp pilus assembly protein PilN